MRSLSIDGQHFHGHDMFGRWVVREVTGWHAPGPKDFGHATIPGARSVTPGVSTAQSRKITVTGVLAAMDANMAAQARNVLTSMLRAPGIMAVDTRGDATYRSVRDPEMDDPVIHGRVMQWQFTVTALDPHRYGGWQEPVVMPEHTDVTVFHRGNTDSAPIIYVAGSAPQGYHISHQPSGVVFDVFAPLTAGSPQVVDMATGRAYIGDNPVLDYGRTKRILVAPGMPQTMRISPRQDEGSLSASVDVQDTSV